MWLVKLLEMFSFGESKLWVQMPDETDGATIMQFTGLFDKNGNEIYENDLLQIRPGEKDSVVWHCVFDKGSFVFLRIGFEVEGGFSYRPDLQVIGNIYENPDLLK